VWNWSIACLLVGLLVPGCGGPKAALQADNQRLQTQVNELRAQARDQRRTIRDLENQLFLMKDRAETAEVAVGRTGDEPALPVEVLEPVPEPAGGDPDYQVVGVDEDGNEIVYVGEAARDRSVAPRLERYTNEPARDLPPAPAGPPITDSGDRITVTSKVPTIHNQLRRARTGRTDRSGARALYQRHYGALRNGDHAAAIAGFRGFLEAYPEHDYADNAQYWLGEAFYDQRKYKEAMREFRRVVKRYPRGNKVPDALLKIGYCYASLGETAKARDVLAQVARIYPASGAAKLAQRKLGELGGAKE
jgi:tol-pal system protein YbgF